MIFSTLPPRGCRQCANQSSRRGPACLLDLRLGVLTAWVHDRVGSVVMRETPAGFRLCRREIARSCVVALASSAIARNRGASGATRSGHYDPHLVGRLLAPADLAGRSIRIERLFAPA